MNKNVAVILSGCGVYDGAEIHESVITLLRLDQRGAKVQCFAPNVAQLHVVDHYSGDEMDETRNVLVESARIARGKIKDVRELHVADFDALIMNHVEDPDLRGAGVMAEGEFASRKGLPGIPREAEVLPLDRDLRRACPRECRSRSSARIRLGRPHRIRACRPRAPTGRSR